MRCLIVALYSGEHRKVKSLVHGHTASRWQSVPEPRLQPPGLRAIAQQMHKRLSPTAAAPGSFPPAVRAASCRSAASQNLPCAKLPIGLLLTHLSVASGSIVAERPRRGGPKSASPTPDSAITSCAPRSKSLSFSGLQCWRRARQGGGQHGQTKPRRTLLHIPQTHHLPGDCWQVCEP